MPRDDGSRGNFLAGGTKIKTSKSSIPVFHAPKNNPVRSSSGVRTSQAPAKNGASGGGGGKSGTKKTSDPYLASQKKAQKKSSERSIANAKALQGQIKALRNSLSTGFSTALSRRLSNISLVSKQQDAILLEGYNARVKSLEDAAADNEKARADATYQNLSNAARERANAVTEALNSGAGESDVLRASMMSLRNWDANQGEVNRSYFDTLRSVNSSLNDLNQDTKTGRANIASQANSDRNQEYTQYYQQRSETLTQLSNLYGQQGEYYGAANEQVGSKGVRKLRNKAVKQSDALAMKASKANAQAWKNPGIGSLAKWQGHDEIEGRAGNDQLQTAANVPERKKPEGATLRKWTV